MLTSFCDLYGKTILRQEKLTSLTFKCCFSFWNSIADIIEHYRKEQIVEGYYLKDPVPMQVRFHFWAFGEDTDLPLIIIKPAYNIGPE